MRQAVMRRQPSRTLEREIATLRSEFSDLTRTWDALVLRRREIAPAFMATFRRWRRETGRSFVAFVQRLDPSVPADRDAYVNHQSYQAALYIQRLAEAPEKAPGARRKRASLTPFDALALMVKSALPLVRPHEETMWRNLAHATRWHERDLRKLREAVKVARMIPLRPDVPRLVVSGRRQLSIRAGAVTHAERGVAADNG